MEVMIVLIKFFFVGMFDERYSLYLLIFNKKWKKLFVIFVFGNEV